MAEWMMSRLSTELMRRRGADAGRAEKAVPENTAGANTESEARDASTFGKERMRERFGDGESDEDTGGRQST